MNSKKLTVIAHFQARPDKEVALRSALIKLIAPTLKEQGCLNYDLHQSLDDPSKFVFYENWVCQEDLTAHLASAHIEELRSKVDELCVVPPEITFWEQL